MKSSKESKLKKYYNLMIDYLEKLKMESDHKSMDGYIENYIVEHSYKRPRNAAYKRGKAGILREKIFVCKYLSNNAHILAQTYHAFTSNVNSSPTKAQLASY